MSMSLFYLCSPVSHQLRLAVRRNEADGVLGLELGQLHTPAGEREVTAGNYHVKCPTGETGSHQ